MTDSLYPPTPAGVPPELTRPHPAYRRRVAAMIAGLFVFLMFYIGLIVLFVLAPSWPQLRAMAICLELGAMETPDLTVTTDYDTARKIFVEQDQAAGMQAFMAGKIKVQGDMMKMMALQTAMPQDEIAKRISSEIKDLTA